MKKLRPDWLVSNSYATTITGNQKKKIETVTQEISKLIALHGKDSSLFIQEDGLVILKGELETIPAFIHPIYIDGLMAVDARAFVNKEGNIKDLAEYQLIRKRALVELAWIEDRVDFGSQTDLVIDVFGSWFSHGIAKRLNMELVDAQNLKVLSAIYYMHFLNRDIDIMGDEVRTRILYVVPRALRVPTNVVEEILDGVGIDLISSIYCWEGTKEKEPVYYLSSMIVAFNKLTDNVYKLDTLSVMNALTRGAFIAANSPEITAVAIEFPPMFFLMVYYTLEKGIHGKTTVGITSHSVAPRHDTNKFNKFIVNILNPSS